MKTVAGVPLRPGQQQEGTVPYYDDDSALHEFVMIDQVPVKVMRTSRGGQCCLTDLRPNETLCPVCGKEATAETVYFPIIRDKTLFLYATDPNVVKELAAKWIADEKRLPKPTERTAASAGKKKPETRKTGSEEGAIDGSRHDEIAKQAAKLGWGNRLAAFLKGEEQNGTESAKAPRKKSIPPRR